MPSSIHPTHDHSDSADLRMRLITPSYNQGAFIGETIRSVLEQDVAGLTYFVADGGSSDETVSILKGLLSPQQWRSEPDGGQTACLIECFGGGDEEILGWVNSDDFLFPGALAKVRDCFRRHPQAAMITGGAVFIDAAGNTLARVGCAPVSARRLEERNLLHQPSTFFRRDSYDRVGGLNPRMSKAFDYDLFLRIVKAGGECVTIDEPLSAFRIHGEGQTTALWGEFLPEILAVQWWHGDRRQFVRRFAEKLWLLCHERDEMSRDEAYEFLARRLTTVLETDAWQADAPREVTGRFLDAETYVRRLLSPHERWRSLGRIFSPHTAHSVARWAGNLTRTGQWRTLWENRRFSQQFAPISR